MRTMITRDDIMMALAPVKDPEIGIGVVDLGLIYDVIVDGSKLTILMTLTTPACPYGQELMEAVRIAGLRLKNITKAEIELVWDPQWNPAEMASDYTKDVLGIW
ncbi:MAG: metal-sulfur cluster assembly factor [candidate division Zixibacteria bacterium]|nr:metal-sulfur cluster assembly factor [candidate division Zixibacteria bacterium]